MKLVGPIAGFILLFLVIFLFYLGSLVPRSGREAWAAWEKFVLGSLLALTIVVILVVAGLIILWAAWMDAYGYAYE
jgi:hypothetical protein